jgi:hypothetical protein
VRRLAAVLPLVAAVAMTTSCGVAFVEHAPAAEPTAAPERVAGMVDPADPTRLQTPYTAGEIRDGWVEGLEIVMRRWTPDGAVRERWTVVAADEAGCETRIVTLDPAGEPAGEPTSGRSTWDELRRHASFPVDRAQRRWVDLETPLGELEGWFYTVEDPDAGTVTEFFFADGYPGAPVWMQVRAGDDVLMALEQVERRRID